MSLVNCSFWGPIDRCVWMRSPFGQFTASACHFVHWDNHAKGAPAIQLDAGKAIVQGCTFAQEGTHVLAGPAVRSAILTGNQAEAGFRVDNQAEARGLRRWPTKKIRLSSHRKPVLTTRSTSGRLGDGRYLKEFNGREERPFEGVAQTARWSSASSQFVPAGRRRESPISMTLEMMVPTAGRIA